MDLTKVCRTCLADSYLHPIFTDNFLTNHITEITGILIQKDDGLPQNICIKCLNVVNMSLKFREQCKNTEEILLRQKNIVQLDHSYGKNITFVKLKTVKVEFESETNEIVQEVAVLNDVKRETWLSENEDMKPEENNEVKESLIQHNEYLTTKDCYDKEFNETEKETMVKIEEPDKSNLIQYLEDPKRVICKICSKNLSVRSIDLHIANKHPGVDERKIKCDLCNKIVMKKRLNGHVLKQHGNGPWKCCYCENKFSTTEALKEHVVGCNYKKQQRHIGERCRKTIECNICHKRMQKASLKLHMTVKHSGVKPMCEHCGSQFGNKFRLFEHYRAKHGYEKLKCPECNFESSNRMAMKNHERRHKGEKPFVCEQCGAKFHAAYLLAQHKQGHREKIVKCKQCPASFKTNNGLHSHVATCHSQRQYRCGSCGRRFRCRQYAARHAALKHAHALVQIY